MKKLLLLTLLFFPFALAAQTNQKYLKGAIQYNDEKKVTFTTVYDLPKLDKQTIYEVALDWSKQRFQPKDVHQARVLYSDAQ